ncbi:hypothetical protein [Rhodovulum sp. 12E13]|uniref:hypothetical protein n=1 Tax=Rhodovulum sp. 12E13 TaxID=2203891 RepID=UPI0018F6E0C7|nr:hypothetical protein [Rhodovulum sp. 12E13]
MPALTARAWRAALLLCLPLALGACAVEEVWAPEEEVQRAIYRHDGPPSITLFTMINNRSNEGAHAGLMVNGSQRLIFDPAGSFNHPQIPERNDVFFGITPAAHDFYIDYHARETFRVKENTLVVTPEQAERVIRLIQQAGPVPPTRCNIAIVEVLREAGIGDIPRSWFPLNTMRWIESQPGVVTRLHRDDSPDNRGDLMRVPLVR